MIRDRRLKTALATFLAAFAVAHLMQFGVTAGRTYSAPSGPPNGDGALALAGLVRSADPFADLPVLPFATGTMAPLGPAAFGDRIPAESIATPALARALNAYGMPCDRALSVQPEADAVLRLRLVATCDPQTRVEVEHAGLRFALVTDMFGVAETLVPALSERADLRVLLPDGGSLSGYAAVPEAGAFDRVAISSDGRSAVEIHAFEFGAGYGGPGHVHHGSNPSEARGDVRRLGDVAADTPLIAEVYTFPSGESLASGTVRLHVEAEVTADNCGREVTANAVQSIPGGPPGVVALRLTMPGCEATGDILVLKNVLRDLRIAGN